MRFILIIIFFMNAFLMLLTLKTVSAAGEIQQKILTIGVVPQFSPRELQQRWQPILHQLQHETGYEFTLLASSNIPEFEKKFETGIFDFAYMNPYHLIVANRAQGYQPLLRDHARALFGIIVVKQGSKIDDILDLSDKIVAFPAPNALGAALIPRTEFATKFNISIQEKYVKSHSSVYLNVALGSTDAGGGVMRTFNAQPAHIKNKLKIIYETTRVAPHPLVVHPRVDNSVKMGVLQAFIAMDKTEEGRSLLDKIPIKQVGHATIEDYKNLLDMELEAFYVR